LPEGYSIKVEVEKDSAGVYMIDDCGKEYPFEDYDGDGLADMIKQALRCAIETQQAMSKER